MFSNLTTSGNERETNQVKGKKYRMVIYDCDKDGEKTLSVFETLKST